MPDQKTSYTVSELNARIRSLLEENLSNIWVSGEISNFHHHPSSGHMYFTLKDGSAELRCVMFRGANQILRFMPENGIEVRVNGSVTIFEQRGQVQLVVRQMEPSGMGDLFKAFEAMKKMLENEGLFEPSHKKPIPKIPRKIGLVTSGSGAALRDILQILERRAPYVDVILRSTKVQGDGSATDIAEGISELKQFGSIDAIIIGRGGGSLEDLWAFNEEIVARTIFDCSIPIISAVGHETDFTITDFVSDLRSPTPSAAAELVSKSKEEIMLALEHHHQEMGISLEKRLQLAWMNVDHLENRAVLMEPRKKIKRQISHLEQFSKRLNHGIVVLLSILNDRTNALNKQVLDLGPRQVLKRGYSIAFNEKNQIIREASNLEIGESFRLKTGKGALMAEKTSDQGNK
ncbi:MAG: exodeoxyribonuclease VII large subunit [Candidatus Neomarinimicrobiota bacterium]|nr:exodeoxyribonuclease VII large subunit [Candidatus Neomarinimicrobiota bacterium]